MHPHFRRVFVGAHSDYSCPLFVFCLAPKLTMLRETVQSFRNIESTVGRVEIYGNV